MGQSWKTLAVVIVLAAVAGWSTVRMLGPGSTAPVARAPGAVPTLVLPEAPAAVVATAARPAATPAAPAATIEEPPQAEGDESAIIVRDLAMLAQALAKDQRIEDRVMPRVNDVLDVPGPTEYRRAPDFWQGAFSRAGETP